MVFRDVSLYFYTTSTLYSLSFRKSLMNFFR